MATISYESDIAAIAVINGNIPGILRSYDSSNMPSQIDWLPCTMVIVAPGTWSRFQIDEYVIRVYVMAMDQGDPAGAYSGCVTLLDLFRETYTDIRTVNGRPVLHSAHGYAQTPKGMGTSGFYYTQTWSGVSFYGFEVYLPLGAPEGWTVPTIDA